MPDFLVKDTNINNIILNNYTFILNNKVIISLFGGITMTNSSFINGGIT